MNSPSWLGRNRGSVEYERLAKFWPLAGSQQRMEAERVAALMAENWAGFEVGDGVLLSADVSKQVLTAYDDEGCVIQLDGVIEDIEAERCKVRVLLESTMAGLAVIGTTLWVDRLDVSRTEGIHVWGHLSAKVHAKKRRGETWGESPFWAS